MTIKGYATAFRDYPSTVGELGAVAGLSTSDTAIIEESFPNSPFWKTDDAYNESDLQKDFDSLVLRDAVVGGYLFPQGFSRDYNTNLWGNEVSAKNTPGGTQSGQLQLSPDEQPPNISFGDVAGYSKVWKAGDPVNPFMPNPSSSPLCDPSKQLPPPKKFAYPSGKESRPPFVGPGSALTPIESSREIARHTLGSYLLGSSKVGGE